LSVIDGSTNKVIQNITVGESPSEVKVSSNNQVTKVYVTNDDFDTVSVIDGSTNKVINENLTVGKRPTDIAINENTNIVYIANEDSNTVSVIDGSTNKVSSAGIKFNVNPPNSGRIICGNDNKEYPTNRYIYVSQGTKCQAEYKKDFEFSGWVENLGYNSTITLNSSAAHTNPIYSAYNGLLKIFNLYKDTTPNFEVTRSGSFTANFKAIPPPLPAEYWASLFGVIASAIIGSWFIPGLISWGKLRFQTRRLDYFYNKIRSHHLYAASNDNGKSLKKYLKVEPIH